jgi:tetratricopeptide (TPR) repeat protein
VYRFHLIRIATVAVLASAPTVFALPQAPSRKQAAITLEGTVHNSAGAVVADASVVLLPQDHSTTFTTKTKTDGTFLFSGLVAGVYAVTSEKSEWGKATAESLTLSPGEKKFIDLVLRTTEATNVKSPSATSAEMEFSDRPNFTVAGVTDWNNVGLHASGTDERTSEALAKETQALKAGMPGEDSVGASEVTTTGNNAAQTEKLLQAALLRAPKSFDANHQLGQFYCHSKKYAQAIPLLANAFQIDSGNLPNSYDLALAYLGNAEAERARDQARKMLSNANSSEAHRLVGDLDERLGDPLSAVREYEQATRLDPSEQNYFLWGTELLLHRAAQPAVEIFTKGLKSHPDSARMLTGLGAALFASGAYNEAALRLCDASDLKPADPAPYLFLGKIEKESPEALPCSEEKLSRFVAIQPANALANYYYGLILVKRSKGSKNASDVERAKSFLVKAVQLDPKLAGADLELGILHVESGDFAHAVAAYEMAIATNPQLGEAHYRLALIYKRIGEETKAQKEMQTYKQIQKADADAREREQRELRQFLIILKDHPAAPPSR